MQTPQATQPAAPTPKPVITQLPGSDVYTVTAPLTAREVASIKARRAELSDQLNSASGRRSRLMKQLEETTNERARVGLEERIAVLDNRMVQIETDIATTGQLLTSAPAGILATTESPSFSGLGSGQVTALSIVFTVVVLGPLAIGTAVIMLKKANRKYSLPPAAFTETAQRLERLEQSVDTIAIEIERISEGQRFVTKLLSEAQRIPALASAKRAESVGAGNG